MDIEESKIAEPKGTHVPTLSPPTSPSPCLTETPTVTPKAGEGGEGGGHHQVTNDNFIKAVFIQVPDGASPAVCSKSGDPTSGGWLASKAESSVGCLSEDKNNFFNCSSFFQPQQGLFSVKKDQVAGYHCLMLDDLGTKVAIDKLGDFELSWLLETSPGNFQGYP